MPSTVRPVTRADVGAVLELIRELADYERSLHLVAASEEDLAAALFAPSPHVFGHVADVDGQVVGLALWFVSFSTWTGRHGVYLEDLYVRPAHRGTGVGGALLAELARICVDRGWTRLEWSVLDWNEPAIAVYQALGAQAQDEWTVHRVTGEALQALAARTPGR